MTYWAAGAAVVGAAGNIYSANKQAKAAKQADPFSKYRSYYGKQLKSLWEDPGSILENPAFKASLDFGLNSVARSMAAQGFLGSGNEATALFDYGQVHALDWLSNQEDFLAKLAGAYQNNGATTVAGLGAAGQGYQDALSQLGATFGLFGGGTTRGYNGVSDLGNYNVTPNFNIDPGPMPSLGG